MPSSHEQPEFFVDRSLGRFTVPDALRAEGYMVHTMHSVYADREEEVEDTEWLSAAGENDWVVLTKDARIRYRGNELAAVRAAGVRIFCITTARLTGAQQAERFVKNLNRIVQRARKPGPYIYAVYERRLGKLWP